MSYYIMFADLLRQPGGENRELLVKDKVKKSWNSNKSAISREDAP